MHVVMIVITPVPLLSPAVRIGCVVGFVGSDAAVWKQLQNLGPWVDHTVSHPLVVMTIYSCTELLYE